MQRPQPRRKCAAVSPPPMTCRNAMGQVAPLFSRFTPENFDRLERGPPFEQEGEMS